MLDSLGVLDPDRVAAMYFALPEERHPVLLRDYACARHVREVERELPEAEVLVRDLIEETPTSELAYMLARLNVGLDGLDPDSEVSWEEQEETVGSWTAMRRAHDREHGENGVR